MNLRQLFLEHRATAVLVALLSVLLFSGQSSDCVYPLGGIPGGLCCDCESFAYCRAGGAGGGSAAPISPTGVGRIHFEANSGQADARYEFVARGAGLSIFLDNGAAWLDLRDERLNPAGVIGVTLAGGAAARPDPMAEEPLSGRINYLLGNDPSRWVRDVPTFGRIRYREVYPGIDLVYYGNQGRLEHDFIVAPGADPSRVRMRLSGADSLRINSEGDAVLQAGAREVTWRKPLLYQNVAGLRRQVEGRYRMLEGGDLGFEVGVFDPLRPLVIDPVVIYSTFVGRGGNEAATRMAVDANGNAYLTGVTADASYPVSPGAMTPAASQGRGNIVVTKLNAAGSEMVFSSILGGSGMDLSLGIVVDGEGSVYVAGGTDSEDFPTTAGVISRVYGKPTGEQAGTPAVGDCFVTKLNAAGNALVYSTYLGGTQLDACAAVAVDGEGNAYLTGGTNSTNFPSTENAFQRNYRGGRGTYPVLKNGDGFVAKINRSGTAILYATFFGGNGEEAGTAIAIDGEGNAYITGSTNSTFGFPLGAGAPQSRYAGSGGNPDFGIGDAFVLKFNATGTALLAGTLLGGAKDDVAFGIAVDKQGAAYITGSTLSTDFPTTAVARQGNYRGQSVTSSWYSGDAFVAKLNPAGTAWEYVTYLGGSADDRGASIVADADGNAWIVGNTLSEDFPRTDDATQSRYGGVRREFYQTGDVFLAKLNASGQTLLFSTYLGGAGNEWALGLAQDPRGAVYVAGGSSSADFPTTAGAYQRAYGTAASLFLPLGDVFLTKFGEGPAAGPQVRVSAVVNAASSDGGGISPGQIVMITGTQIGPATPAAAAPSGGSFPTTVGQTQILFDGVAAPVLYASERQLNAVVPYGVAGKQRVEVVVSYQGVRSPAVSVPVVASLPGLFSANASGRGQAAALNQDGSVNSASNPAERGSVVVLYGTGEGETIPPGVDGRLAAAPLARPVLPVNVTMANIVAPLLYAGAAPGLVNGVLQINVQLPDGVGGGDVPVVVRVGDRTSQAGLTIAVR